MTAGFAALSLRRSGGWRRGGPSRGSFSYRRDGGAPRDRTRPLQALSRSRSSGRCGPGGWSRPRRVGWGVGTQIDTVSEVRQLAPHSLGAVEDLNTFEAATGTTGDLEVLVEAPDLTDPATIEWMAGFKRRVLKPPTTSPPARRCRTSSPAAKAR